MFPKKNRVTKKLFDNVMKNGTVVHGDYIYVRYVDVNDGVQRCSVVVPKKVFKKAHDRNRVKRQINSVLVSNKTLLPQKHLIFFAKPSIREIDRDILQADILKLIQSLTK